MFILNNSLTKTLSLNVNNIYQNDLNPPIKQFIQ